MGTWGYQFDENDDAADWLGEFAAEPGWEATDHAFEQINRGGDAYIEAPECQSAVAAAAVVAAGLGAPLPSLQTSIASWAASNVTGAKARIKDASSALTRIRDASELQELWDESDESAIWRGTLDDLLAQLN